jgi:hypothetical protein
VSREENKKFLKGLSGELYMKGEGLLKYEYCILQERVKNEIVKDYVESEIRGIDQEKSELLKEREKYANLLELERTLEEDKRRLDDKRAEFKVLVEDIKKSF